MTAAVRWQQRGGCGSGASAEVETAQSAAAGHSSTAAERWQQHGGCGGGGRATAQCGRQLGGGAAAVAASAVVVLGIVQN